MVNRFHSDLLASFNLCLWVSCVVLAVLGLCVRPVEGLQVKKEVEVPELVLDVSMQEQASLAEVSAGSDALEANVVSSDLVESVAAEPPPLPPVAPELQTELPQLPEIPTIHAPAAAVAPVVDVAKKPVASAPVPRSSPKSVGAATTRSNGVTAGAAKASRGAVTTLTFGQGQGRQPAPIYPLRARRAMQQGTVMVEFLVAESGEVSSAWLERPCPWPILNEAAVETIRRRWHFESGAVRRYRIPIVFTLE